MVTDSAKEIKNKINRYAFSGGQATAEDQRRLGANLEVDVPFQYLRFFMEDDAEVERIGADYAAGRLLTGDVKARLVDTLAPMVLAHQAARAAVTDDVVREFMRVRALDFVTTDAARAAREGAGK
jgi:tryptophanyl-tRNA synthetase